MGAWGTGKYDNDDAGDWAAEFDDAATEQRRELLEETFALASDRDPDEPLEVDECGQILAAAATVTALLPGGPPVDPDSGPRELADAGLQVDESLRTSAITTVNAVLDDESEWHELWAEADSLEEATAPVRRVLDALNDDLSSSADG